MTAIPPPHARSDSAPTDWIEKAPRAGLTVMIALFTLAYQFGTPASGQENWQGLLAPERAHDWENYTGIPGGIPNRATICETVDDTYTTAELQTAIDNCGVDEVVYFSAGTYVLSGAGLHSNQPVVLRGAGPNSTTIVMDQDNILLGCCGTGGLGSYPNTASSTNWTGGLTRGSTVLTVDSTSSLGAGQTVILNELNPAWVFKAGAENDENGVASSAGCIERTGNPAYFHPGLGNSNSCQLTKIVSVDSSTQITIADPVYYDHSAELDPEVFYWSDENIEYAGVEDMRIDANQVAHAIILAHCDYCWVQNVWVQEAGRSAFTTRYSYRNEIRNNYADSQTGGGPTEYGHECETSTGALVENNIFINVTASILLHGCQGSVVAYNYIHNSTSGFLFHSGGHSTHNMFHLIEGNDMDRWIWDNIHSGASHGTMYRNRVNGYGANKTNGRIPMETQAQNLFMNFVGNVLGREGYHTDYVCNDAVQPGSDTYIWGFGFWDDCPMLTDFDTVAESSAMRWWNWDADTYDENGDTNGIRMCTARGSDNSECTENERGNGDPTFPALTNPISSNFPDSLYLDSKPSFFGIVAWPPIGPDVSCSSDCVPNAGAHAEKIPARVCYESLSKSGVYAAEFDADTCYPIRDGG